VLGRARAVSDLAIEEGPATATRGGAAHAFDRDVVRRIHEALSPLERRRVRLPVTFYVEHELPEDAYVSDEAALPRTGARHRRAAPDGVPVRLA